MPVYSKARVIGAACLTLWLVAPVQAQAMPAARSLDIVMQAQEQTQWCWAGSGNTIADFHGATITQTRFCQLAHGESGATCANTAGTLGDAQHAYASLGFSSPGTYLADRVGYEDIKAQIEAGRPIQTRIGWNVGGGHIHVVYGYDSVQQRVYWGDPWPTNSRYNLSTYSYYSSNRSFSWTHTLTGIAK